MHPLGVLVFFDLGRMNFLFSVSSYGALVGDPFSSVMGSIWFCHDFQHTNYVRPDTIHVLHVLPELMALIQLT